MVQCAISKFRCVSCYMLSYWDSNKCATGQYSVYFQSKMNAISDEMVLDKESNNNQNACKQINGVYVQLRQCIHVKRSHFSLISMTLLCYLHFYLCVIRPTINSRNGYGLQALTAGFVQVATELFSAINLNVNSILRFQSEYVPAVALQIPDFRRCWSSLKMSRLFLVVPVLENWWPLLLMHRCLSIWLCDELVGRASLQHAVDVSSFVC